MYRSIIINILNSNRVHMYLRVYIVTNNYIYSFELLILILLKFLLQYKQMYFVKDIL